MDGVTSRRNKNDISYSINGMNDMFRTAPASGKPISGNPLRSRYMPEAAMTAS